MSKILVLGAGELGMAILRGLASRGQEFPGTEISVLLRPSSAARPDRRERELEELGVDVLPADLAADSVEELAAVFHPFDAVISCSGFAAGAGTQVKITRAVLLANVRRYFPWQFGVDYDAIGSGSGQSTWDEQLDVRRMLREQSSTSWVIVSTGMFTSYLFEPSFGVVDLENGVINALGDWENELTLTTPQDIGLLTAEIFFCEPEIANSVVFVAGDTISYASLKQLLGESFGREFRGELLTREELRTFSSRHPDDTAGKYRLAFARSSGVAWDKAGTFNEHRGIPTDTVRDWLKAKSGGSVNHG